MNSIVVSLIPKIQGVDSIEDFRLIVVANFKFKTIFKILVDRLAMVASRIISPNQYEFFQGRHIHYCIGVAYEAINMLSKKVRGGNVAYKVDIHKAFDTLSWNFLLLVLTHFGFHPSSFVTWISTILQSAMLSIRIYRSYVGFFPCSRYETRCFFFFCLAKEVLSRDISKLVNDKSILHMASPKGYITKSFSLHFTITYEF